jgi:hypothetical protein
VKVPVIDPAIRGTSTEDGFGLTVGRANNVQVSGVALLATEKIRTEVQSNVLQSAEMYIKPP